MKRFLLLLVTLIACDYERAAAPLQVSVHHLGDSRSSDNSAYHELGVALELIGWDARPVRFVREHVTKAVDDTGRSLIDDDRSRWYGSYGFDSPPLVSIKLANPTRQAKKLTALEGMIEVYRPYVDRTAVVKIDRIVSMKDKRLITDPQLAKENIRLQLLSKQQFEKERMTESTGKKGGIEPIPGWIDEPGHLLENDLMLKVDDPGGRIFAFRLVMPGERPIVSSLDSIPEGKERPVREVNYHPIDAAAILEIHLKTAKTYARVPFKLSNVKLP